MKFKRVFLNYFSGAASRLFENGGLVVTIVTISRELNKLARRSFFLFGRGRISLQFLKKIGIDFFF